MPLSQTATEPASDTLPGPLFNRRLTPCRHHRKAPDTHLGWAG